MEVTREERQLRWIAWVTSGVLIAVSLFLAKPGSTYRFAFLFLAPLLWLVYSLRHQLVLAPSHFALFASFLLLHNLGVFGFYRRHFLGLQFDVYVHFYFGLVGGFVVKRAFEQRCGWRGPWLVAAVGLFLLGIGAVHELVECGTTILLGKEKGMLKLDPNDPYDTQKDLLNNLLGALLAVAISSVATRIRRKRTAARTEEEPGHRRLAHHQSS